MQDDPAFSWLVSAEPAWSGHYAALADRLTRPDAVHLTEEQVALALGIAQRLVSELAEKLPIAIHSDAIWARWEAQGMPSGQLLAPSLLARVEEHRWRRQASALTAEPPVPLFQIGGPAPDAMIDIPAELVEQSPIDAAYLALRIADGARVSAMGQPLLLSAELSLQIERALLLDLAAEEIAADEPDKGRAAELAKAIDAVSQTRGVAPIDLASRAYHSAARNSGLLGYVASAAVARRDWLVVIALLSAELGAGFSRVSALLLAMDDDRLCAALSMIGVAAPDSGPLLDALADVPGRPLGRPVLDDQSGQAATLAAVAARAANLRDRGA